MSEKEHINEAVGYLGQDFFYSIEMNEIQTSGYDERGKLAMKLSKSYSGYAPLSPENVSELQGAAKERLQKAIFKIDEPKPIEPIPTHDLPNIQENNWPTESTELTDIFTNAYNW